MCYKLREQINIVGWWVVLFGVCVSALKVSAVRARCEACQPTQRSVFVTRALTLGAAV